MRTAFIDSLIAEARAHQDIFLIVGDLGYSVVEPFASEFPNRFLNAGIAEQNMTGMAAGLASEGWHVFTYSIANFPTLRCLEQIRNDVCYHQLPVTVVSVGAGLAYGSLGYSHHAVQDLACLGAMPFCTVLSPADPGEAQAAVRHLAERPGPSYLRLGKAGEPSLHPPGPMSRQPVRVTGPPDAVSAVVATGSILKEAISAAERWPGAGEVAVYSMPWMAPVADEDLAGLWRHQRLVTVEEHVSRGGLGELVASRRPDGVSVRRLSLREDRVSAVGSQESLRRVHEVDAASILRALESVAKGFNR